MDDLIWSIKPKHTLEERKRLVAMQPTLLSNLRSGMERLSVPATERDDFIAKLVHAHGRTAINKALEEDGQEEDPQAAETSAPDQDVADTAPEHRETATKAQLVRRPSKRRKQPEPPIAPKDEYNDRVRMLKTGTWMEINGNDDKAMRAKLSWISPITGTYLFTDRQGLKAGNFTVDELAELLRSRRARVLSSTPLMDRAVGTVLKQYQQQ
jgi:hypothetical protein